MNVSEKPTCMERAGKTGAGRGIPEFAGQLAKIHLVSLRLGDMAQTFFDRSDANDPRMSMCRSAETGLKLALGLARLSDRYRIGLQTLRQFEVESARGLAARPAPDAACAVNGPGQNAR